MARINGVSYPGITVQKDWQGNISDITINIKRCSDEVKDFLKSIGIVKPTGKELTIQAIQELEEGGGTYCETFEDYKQAVADL